MSGEVKSGGYDADFDPPLTEDYACCICCLAYREPMQLECGHQYCRSCLEHHSTTQGMDFCCPVDRERIDMTKSFPDKAMSRKVFALNVRCSNLKHSCPWSGDLRDLQEHIANCPFHVKVCLHCSESFFLKNEEEHLSTCQLWPLECPNGCGDSAIPRKDMDVHLDTCTLKRKPCSYCDVGCTFTGSKSELEDHKHLQIAMSRLALLETKSSQFEKTIEKLEETNQKLEKTNKCFQERLKTLENHHTPKPNAIGNLPKYLQNVLAAAEKCKYGEKVFSVSNYTKNLYKSENTFYSDPFYSHEGGYKLRIQVCLYGINKEISLCLQVMPGPNDNELRWPFGIEYKLSLLHHSCQCNCSRLDDLFSPPLPIVCERTIVPSRIASFNKPTNDNTPHGFAIQHKSITNRFLIEDSLYFRCKLRVR